MDRPIVFHDTKWPFKKGSYVVFLFFFAFVYGNTMLMTMTKAWNMTALNTSPLLIATVSIYSL